MIVSAMNRAKRDANPYLDGGSRAPDSRRCNFCSFCEQREGTRGCDGPGDLGETEGATSGRACNRRRHDGVQVVSDTDQNSADDRVPSWTRDPRHLFSHNTVVQGYAINILLLLLSFIKW